MKNFKMMVVVGITALALTACGGGEMTESEAIAVLMDEDASTDDRAKALEVMQPIWEAQEAEYEEEEAEVETPVLAVGETYTYPDGVSVTVGEAAARTCQGNRYMTFPLTIENGTGAAWEPDVSQAAYTGDTGEQITPIAADCGGDDFYATNRMQPEVTAEFTIAYDTSEWDESQTYVEVWRGIDGNTAVEYTM